MTVVPCFITDAKRFVARHHRHNLPPVSGLFAVGLMEDGELVAVGIAGRTVARKLNDGYTVEITRCCTLGTKNAGSMVYGALCRAAKALGWRKAVTYTRQDESGISLRAAGFTIESEVPAATWDSPSRPRLSETLFGTMEGQDVPKYRWGKML